MVLTDDYLNDLMVRMAHHSTAIEGNSLSQGETKSVLIDAYIPRAMDMGELHEVLNYKKFMPVLVDALTENAPIGVPFVRHIHEILCENAVEGVPGAFKTVQNLIVGADFTPTAPYLVPTALHDWALNLEAQLESAASDTEHVEAICRQHIAFERIHPFPDGNGRTGRALMAYSCLRAELPPIVIPVEQKLEYINCLNTENLPVFAAFAEALVQAERARMMCFGCHIGP